MQQNMLQNFTNSFCIDGEGVIEKNVAVGVKTLNLLTSNPLLAAKKYQQFSLAGKIIVKPDEIKFSTIKKLQKQGIDLALYIDLSCYDEKQLEKFSALNMPVFIPLFDNLKKTGEIASQYGISPAKLIEDMGFLDRDCTIVGGEYADKDDLEILGSYGAKMAVCPIFQSQQGETFSNVVLMQKMGLKVQLGSGGNAEINMTGEANYLYLTTLSLLENPQAVSREEIQRMTGENYEN